MLPVAVVGPSLMTVQYVMYSVVMVSETDTET